MINKLVLVTLPIGNEEDITYKAKRILESSEIIYAEDTRVFKELCKKISIDYSAKQIRSFHDHSSEKQIESIIQEAKERGCVFVSDAGSPVISDPAFPLIQMAISEGLELETAGGISSVIVALELSGLPPIPFHFHGFLARDKGKRDQAIEDMASQYGTHIFFEGKSRVISTLEALSKLYPENQIALGRELTKKFESVYRFKGNEFKQIKDSIEVLGEFVIVFYQDQKRVALDNELIKLASEIIDKGAKPKKLAKILATISGRPVKEVYEKLSITRQ